MVKRKEDYVTAGNHVYTFLRSSILGLLVKPGESINVKELSEHLNVSRSPVRDALIQLEKEGLVTTLPQKGTFVSQIDVRRVRDERFLRACLEERIVQEFIEVMTEADIAQMEYYIAQQEKMVGDARKFIEQDDLFHQVIFIRTNHPFCLEFSHNMSGHYQRIRLLSLVEFDICMQTIEEHKEIIRLIRSRDLVPLKSMLFHHIVEKNSEERKLKSKHSTLFIEIEDSAAEKGNIWENDFLRQI